MALNKQIVRLSKLLVDREKVSFQEAQERLLALTLEIRVGGGSASPAAHAAALTAASVGRRTFVGGVRVTGELDQPLLSPLSRAATLREALVELNLEGFEGRPAQRVFIGEAAPDPGAAETSAWWDGWRAGLRRENDRMCGDASNPLAGVAAGAAVVGAAFEAMRGAAAKPADLDLWPGGLAPSFTEVFLPSTMWADRPWEPRSGLPLGARLATLRKAWSPFAHAARL